MTARVRAEEALDSDIESSWRLQQDEDEDWEDEEDWDEDEEWDEDEDWGEDEEWEEGEDDYDRGPRRHPDEWH